MSVFRDGGKAVQVLSNDDADVNVRRLKWGEKRDLPEERICFEREMNIAGLGIHFIVSEYPDGRPGQLAFLALKEGSTLGGLLKSHGILASKALKRGLPLEHVAASWEGHNIDPSGIVYKHPHIHDSNSPLDLAAKILRLEYLGDISVAADPQKLDITKLRGYKNGVFFNYAREGFDEWDFDQVIKDPVLGGFVPGGKEAIIKQYLKSKIPIGVQNQAELKKLIDEGKFNSGSNGKNSGRSRGKCPECKQESLETLGSSCAQCNNCGFKIGGCAS